MLLNRSKIQIKQNKIGISSLNFVEKIRLQNSRFISKIVNSRVWKARSTDCWGRVRRPLERVRKKYGCFAAYDLPFSSN